MTLCESQHLNYISSIIYSYTLFRLKPMKIDNNPFTANKITIILVSKPISAANIFIVRHGELVL